MASYQDLLDAIARVRAATGDADAWMTGLSGEELAAVTSPTSVVTPGAVDTVLAKVRAQHRAVFEPPMGVPAPQEGTAAEAIRTAETSLARQNSLSAQVDLQVITAVLNAHATHTAGRAALDDLQDEIEAAVSTRTDLGTPAGARGFQRYLVDKLRDIRTVVETAGLDATSKAALAAALASLYAAATPAIAPESEAETHPEPTAGEPAREHRPPRTEPDPMPVRPAEAVDDPLLDQLLAEQPGPPPTPDPTPPSQPTAAPMPPPMPAVPAFGGAGLPAGTGAGLLPPSMTDPVLSARRGGDEISPADELPADDLPVELTADTEPAGEPTEDDPGQDEQEPAEVNDEAAVVHLPDGDTVTAPSPQIAAAITAAVAGTPIADAFRQQGITVPAPGTAVAHPVDPARLLPGDIGMLTDRHALALGNGKALFNRQIEAIASVTGPSFLGWEHPPEPGTSSPPTTSEHPTPTRPAVTAGPSG